MLKMKRSWIFAAAIISVTLSGCTVPGDAVVANIMTQMRENQKQAEENASNPEAAITAQKKVIELTPENPGAFTALSNLYIQNKQYNEAITAAKRAIELKPDLSTAYFCLGAAYGSQKNYDEGMQAFKKVIELDHTMSVDEIRIVYSWMGQFFMEQNAYDDAVAAYKKVIGAAPSEPNINCNLALAYYCMGRYDDALAMAAKAIESEIIPGGVGAMIVAKDGYPTVKELIEAGPAQKAGVQINDRIMKIDRQPTMQTVMKEYFPALDIGTVAKALRGTAGTPVDLIIEREAKMIKITVVREKLVPQATATSLGVRSLIYRQKGDMDDALVDAERAFALHPSDVYALLARAAVYLDREQYDEAIKLLSPVKEGTLARLLEATAKAKQGKMQDAISTYLLVPQGAVSAKNIPLTNDRNRLLQMFAPSVKEDRDKANSLQAKGKDKEALSQLCAAWQIADDTQAPQIQESMFSLVKKNSSLAEIPDEARKYALRAELLVKDGNFKDAGVEYDKAITAAPYSAQLYFNAALNAGELKKYPEAIRCMKVYLKAVPDAPNARELKDEITKWEFMEEKRAQ